MKKIISFIFLSILIKSNFSLGDIEKGKWNFVKDPDYCYIGSSPTVPHKLKTGQSRGDTYILVYTINRNPEAIVQIEAGYPYNTSKIIEVKIDSSSYKFKSQDETPETAWTEKDDEIIYAMKKGAELKVIGISKKGTKTIDTYTLKGFTAAFNKLKENC
tara:strand:+ start:167 stop:643 length:477 start_codon:yes stop_codon:yes gene_type:complete